MQLFTSRYFLFRIWETIVNVLIFFFHSIKNLIYLFDQINQNISCSGKCSYLKDRATRAFTKTKKQLGPFFRAYPELTLKMIKAVIEPILL